MQNGNISQPAESERTEAQQTEAPRIEAQENASPQHATPVFHRRLVIGLTQGAMLYLLLHSDSAHVWPATSPILFALVVALAALLPPLLIVGSGHIRLPQMLRWMLPLGFCVALTAGCAAWRWVGVDVGSAAIFPHHHFYEALFYLVPLVFIAWSLIQAGEHDKRWIADYRIYFDTSWKFAVQLKFAAAFVCAFWLVLWLGAGLFTLLKIDFLLRLIIHDWFWLPVTTLMMASGLHLTDVRPGIVNGIRNLLLSMLSWLLPLLALLVAAFLVAIPLAGFELLWKTRVATGLLLGTCGVLVILVNATYQGGDRADAPHVLLRHAVSLACVLLLPLATIAAYALSLRVAQYGWTPDRVLAALCVCVALFYACGYLWALLDPHARRAGRWLPHVAATNVYTAWLIVALALAVLTPLADPARLSVASQMGRLLAGSTAADKFDYKFLRFEGVRYGKAALDKLAASDNAAIRERAVATLALKSRWETPAIAKASIPNQLTLRSVGQTWPVGFMDTAWDKQEQSWIVPACLRQVGDHCDAFIGDFSGRGRTEVLLVPEKYGNAALAANDDGWRIVATFEMQPKCPAVLDALAHGKYQHVPQAIADIEVGGLRMRAIPLHDSGPVKKCD